MSLTTNNDPDPRPREFIRLVARIRLNIEWKVNLRVADYPPAHDAPQEEKDAFAAEVERANLVAEACNTVATNPEMMTILCNAMVDRYFGSVGDITTLSNQEVINALIAHCSTTDFKNELIAIVDFAKNLV